MASDLKLTVILNAVDQATGELRKITRGSGELAKTFRASKDQLKELNKQQSDVRAYRIANAETTRQARAIRDLEVKSRGYSQSLDQQRTAHTNLRGNLKTAQSEYNKLAKALINGKGGSAEFQRELQKSQIRLTSARQAFERSSSSIRTYQNQIRSTDKRLAELNRSHGAGQQRLTALRQRLEQAGIGTQGLGHKARQMRQEQERVNAVLDQQRAALARVNEIQRRNQQLNERHAKTMRRTAMVGAAGYAGVAVGRNVLTRASNVMAPGLAYGAQISELQAITRLGKDDERFAMLKAQARQLGATTAFSATEVAAGQTFLARAGFTPEAISASMGDVLAMAIANKTDLARTADIASNIAGVFKLDPSIEGNVTRLADVLTGTAARANVNLEMLGETMKYLGGADDLNLTIEQAAAMAGLMGNIGIQGSQAGTAMRAMMNRLTGPAAAGRKVMEELGLQVADANGDLRELPEILRDINTATKDLGNVQRKAMLTRIFGAEAGSGMAELVGQMADGGLDELLEQLGDLQGENARMARVMADNVQGDLKNLSSAWEDIGITLAQTNEGPIRDLINSVTDTVRKIGEWAKKNPQLVATIAKVVGVVGLLAAIGGTLAITLASIAAPISLVMFGLGKMFLIGKTLLPIIKAVTLAVGALGKAFLLNPIGLAIAAIAAAAYLFYRNWEGIVGGLSIIWEQLGGNFLSVLNTIGKAILDWSPVGLFYRAFAAVMDYFGINLPATFTEFGKNLIQGLINGFAGMFPKLAESIGNIADSTVGWFKDMLGIRSPSRVFAELGGYTMQGLAQGINREQREPLEAVAAVADRIASTQALTDSIQFDNRRPLAARPVATAATSSNSYEIHIHPAPGMDAQAIGRAVAAELDRRERERAARGRSALYDQE